VADDVRPFFVAGQWRSGQGAFRVESPYDRGLVAEVSTPSEDDVEAALAAAQAVEESSGASVACGARRRTGFHLYGAASSARRDCAADRFRVRKPLKWARVEASRAASTFPMGGRRARRPRTELLRLDTDPAGAGRLGLVRRFPLGPILGITPFNFPLTSSPTRWHRLWPWVLDHYQAGSVEPLGALLLAEIFRRKRSAAGHALCPCRSSPR